jgi:hypothetical protein
MSAYYQPQVLLSRPPYGAAVSIGRTWIKLGKPTRSIARAERITRNARIDDPDAVTRIREVRP